MPSPSKVIRAGFRVVGLDPVTTWRFFSSVPGYLADLRRFKKAARLHPDVPQVRELRPMVGEAGTEAGSTRNHYFLQDLWMAQRIFARRPARHVDVGSRIDGFIAHLLTFMPVEVVDIRALKSDVPGMTFIQADATDMTRFDDGSIESLSSLHAVEHFGLGRYGDPLDPSACYKAMKSFVRVLKPGGVLYFSVPIGRERVIFNCERVFNASRLVEVFQPLRLERFASIDDAGVLVEGSELTRCDKCYRGCGLFVFTK